MQIRLTIIKILEAVVKATNWIRFAIISIIVSTIVAFVVYNNYKVKTGTIIAASIVLIGILAGVFWATYIIKKYGGTTNYDERVMASPDLDNLE